MQLTVAPSKKKEWLPTLGACAQEEGVQFFAWAPNAEHVDIVIERDRYNVVLPLDKGGDDVFQKFIPGLFHGDLYRFRINNGPLTPDPASRYQPQGISGPSQIVNPKIFPWSDHHWRGVELEDLNIYELHIGTFSRTGDFAGATERLSHLSELGISAIELMPVAEFRGSPSWGYDSAFPFAPEHAYGTPDDLRRLIDAAHHWGLAVILDVTFNHEGTIPVHRFLIENALHWVHEYHVDGLRVDGVTSNRDGDLPSLAGLSSQVRDYVSGRHILLMAGETSPISSAITPPQKGGLGMNAAWADDFYIELHRHVVENTGTTAGIAQTLRHGWLDTQEPLDHNGISEKNPLSLNKFILALENHEIVGTRRFGKRFHQEIDLASFRAASALLFFVPETPLLFMGQEWAATSPFYHFADQQTFLASRLNWAERNIEPHASVLRLYQALLKLRKVEPALRHHGQNHFQAEALNPEIIAVRRDTFGSSLLLVACLKGKGECDLLHLPILKNTRNGSKKTSPWMPLLSTEDPAFSPAPVPASIDFSPATSKISFPVPSAVILKRTY